MQRTVTLVVTALVVLSTAPVAATGTTQEMETLEIAVVNTADEPVSGATLVATWDGGEATETTRSNGKAFVDVPTGATVEVEIQSEEYIRNRPYTIEDASERQVEITVARKGSAVIEVRNARGEPVPNAVVWMRHNGNYVVNERTDRNGVHETETLEQGEYRVTVLKDGYFRNRTTLQVDGDRVRESLTIERGSVPVTVQVTDDHFSPPQPVENARIQVGDVGSVQTLGDGENTIRVPVNADYDVTVTKEGYEEATPTLEVGEEATTLSATIQRTPGLNIGLSDGQVAVGEPVRVEVSDEYDTPVDGASVALNGEVVGETDGDGRLSVTIEEAGENTIDVEADGFNASATVRGVDPSNGTDAGTETQTETESSDGLGPGFTPVVAVIALLLVAARLRRH